MEKRSRATIQTPGVGTKRHYTYRHAIDQYHLAMSQGFYIEAISLMESLIGDRLESLANELSKSDAYSCSTLEKLLTFLCGRNQASSLQEKLKDVLNEICIWKNSRNKAIHEMAKEINHSFADNYNALEEVADEGYTLFRELDNAIREHRKQSTNIKQQ